MPKKKKKRRRRRIVYYSKICKNCNEHFIVRRWKKKKENCSSICSKQSGIKKSIDDRCEEREESEWSPEAKRKWNIFCHLLEKYGVDVFCAMKIIRGELRLSKCISGIKYPYIEKFNMRLEGKNNKNGFNKKNY